jgi:hypothetical protein
MFSIVHNLAFVYHFFAKIGKKIAKIILLRKQSAEENEKNVYNQIHTGKSLLFCAAFV